MGKNLVEIICAKDEQAAKPAAAEFIKRVDIEEFQTLCQKMDFLFDFVRENVYRRLSSAINKDNFKSLISFFEFYSYYFDDFFSSELAKYADEDLTDEMYEILINGSDSQKTYAAAYFKKIPDTVAIDDLINNLETEFEPLFLNCAAALGKMGEKTVFEKYKSFLNFDDEFLKLKAVKFFTAYGDKTIIKDLISSMKTSSMPENLAGEIVNLISPTELISNDFESGILLFNNIINGLGEILPLENIFYYEVYDVANYLFENIHKPQSVVVLYNLKNKIKTFTENDEYIFDLDKNTKNEIFNIKKFILSKNEKLNSKKHLLKNHITENSPYLTTVLEIIKEENLKEFETLILDLTLSKNETVVCEAICTLKDIGSIEKVNFENLDIKNENIKAILEQVVKLK